MQRFWNKVAKSDGCWTWTSCRDKDGYGRFRYDGKIRKAHRFSYELLVEEIPKGLELDHRCKNPSCVNPAHLEPVTHAENIMRSDNFVADQVRRTHCPSGHAYDTENTLRVRVGKSIARQCRACKRSRKD